MSNGNSYIGQQIGNYLVIKELASGSFGSVYQGRHMVFTDEPIVAIKLLHAHLASQQEYDRFFQEARLLKKLKYPYILPIIDAGVHQNFPYIVAEYAPNGSLRDRLKRRLAHPLPTEEILTILSQVGQALHYAHRQNIVHRDLKPENILFNVKGEALLADFGIATVLATASVKQTTIMGTPSYMAPEQFRGIISKESDQYGLGCIAYELFTGSKPFNAPDFFALGYKHLTEYPIAPTQFNPQLPKYIEQAIFKAIMKERADRHIDCSAFIRALNKPYTVEQVIGRNLSLVVGTRTDPGIKRKHKPNEDSLFAMQGARTQNTRPERFGLFVVADGMSDHINGQDASRLAIQTIINYVLPILSAGDEMNDEGFGKLLSDGVQQANQAVNQNNQERRADMGTTMTAALVAGSMAYVASVGDSRTYLYREPEGLLTKITHDHSIVASLVDAGVIKPDDIYTHPKRNQIYRSLGEKPVVEVDTFIVQLQSGDKLLLCSDGLWKMVRDPDIQRLMHAPVSDPSQTTSGLIQAALDGGGEENVSVIVVHMTEVTRRSGVQGIQLLAKPDSVRIPNM